MTDKLDELFNDRDELQLVVFKLDKEDFCVPITSVQEIIMSQTPTKLPGVPEFVEGVINLRGHILPVIDGCKKLGLSQGIKNSFESRIIILNIRENMIGLIVNLVSEVIHLKKNEIEPPPSDFDNKSDLLWGIGKCKDKLLILINPNSFLGAEELQGLKNINNSIKSIDEASLINQSVE